MNGQNIKLFENLLASVIAESGLPEPLLIERVLEVDERNDTKKVKHAKYAIEKLINENFLREQQNKTNRFISPGPLCFKYENYQDYLSELEDRNKTEFLNLQKDEKKRDLEIESLEKQIYAQKMWFWKLIIGLVLAQIFQILYLIFFDR
jgi:hypothetical protein